MYKILILSLVLCACALTYADQPELFTDGQFVNSEVEVLPLVRPAAEDARDIDGFGSRAYGYRPYGYRPYGYRPYRPYGYRPYGYRPYGGAYYG